MSRFVQAIRDVEVALGSNRRIMHPEELLKRQRIRRSAYLKQAGKAGQKLSELQVEFRRPGFGMAPNEYEALLDCVLARDLDSGHMLLTGDLTNG